MSGSQSSSVLVGNNSTTEHKKIKSASRVCRAPKHKHPTHRHSRPRRLRERGVGVWGLEAQRSRLKSRLRVLSPAGGTSPSPVSVEKGRGPSERAQGGLRYGGAPRRPRWARERGVPETRPPPRPSGRGPRTRRRVSGFYALSAPALRPVRGVSAAGRSPFFHLFRQTPV